MKIKFSRRNRFKKWFYFHRETELFSGREYKEIGAGLFTIYIF